MQMRRITTSLPDYLYQQIITIAPKGNVSKFVANTLEKEILSYKINKSNPVDDFFAMRNKLPKISSEKIMAAIKKGRT